MRATRRRPWRTLARVLPASQIESWGTTRSGFLAAVSISSASAVPVPARSSPGRNPFQKNRCVRRGESRESPLPPLPYRPDDSVGLDGGQPSAPRVHPCGDIPLLDIPARSRIAALAAWLRLPHGSLWITRHTSSSTMMTRRAVLFSAKHFDGMCNGYDFRERHQVRRWQPRQLPSRPVDGILSCRGHPCGPCGHTAMSVYFRFRHAEHVP